MARKIKKEHHEEHADETWLVPYSDILTLLLALFIVLFASAQVDQKKFDQLKASFSIAFSGSPALLENPRPTQPESSSPNPPVPHLPTIMEALQGTNEKAYMQETVQLIELKKTLDQYIADNGLGGDLTTTLTDDGLVIRIQDTALFPSGSADLRPESRRFGTHIAKLLTPLTQKVTVSGHTDNLPINTREFPSNWELSSRRAVNFMRFLMAEESGLRPERFSATGYGEYRPVAGNNTSEGRSANRRVEVFIQRNYRL
ncbi:MULTISPECIES: flagellar motor protein MotB [Sporomusa]|jgi:chemotaxis protein MotB|uniref:flagellar motor protein MotB n=1 Tax=Sporomusa TaxID=2375 RepID=UPI00166B16A3|nr:MULTISPECIES: flagellar motor protein MotB [Sporomusa]HML35723.1 flagellar motor protein MotB [Sporomusa sphaeroides]